MERYSRQEILKGFGEEGQTSLAQASVLVIGAGGLGCPLLMYLVGMGVGTIGIVDDDEVSISNLHRQPLYSTVDVGRKKVEAAKEKLTAQNPEIKIDIYHTRLSQANVIEIFANYKIIVDCSDNFATRYMVNDACVLMGLPLVYAAVSGYEGQVAVFNVNTGKSTTGNYRDLYAEMPQEGEILNCAEAGVLGILPGIIGTMQAAETIKLITKIGEPLLNKIWTYSLHQQEAMLFTYEPKNLKRHENIESFLQENYDLSCIILPEEELSIATFEAWRDTGEYTIVDVRENHELPHAEELIDKNIPFQRIDYYTKRFKEGKYIFICQTGRRSALTVQKLKDHFQDNARFYSLKGGILAWYKETKHEEYI
jgi:sulfur-carrier protein adenylyltransferase/sulfurtransferase